MTDTDIHRTPLHTPPTATVSTHMDQVQAGAVDGAEHEALEAASHISLSGYGLDSINIEFDLAEDVCSTCHQRTEGTGVGCRDENGHTVPISTLDWLRTITVSLDSTTGTLRLAATTEDGRFALELHQTNPSTGERRLSLEATGPHGTPLHHVPCVEDIGIA